MKPGYSSNALVFQSPVYTIIFLLSCLLICIRCNSAVSANPSQKDETIRYHKNGIVKYMKGKNLSLGLEGSARFSELQRENRYGDIAYAFLESRKDILSIQNPILEFQITSEKVDDLGLKHIKFQQVFKKVPIWAKEVIVHLDKHNHVYMFQGKSVATIHQLQDGPLISEQQAADYAKQNKSKGSTGWEVEEGKLFIYMLKGSVPRLAYKITLAKGLADRDHYFIDATNGAILHKISGIQH